MLDEFDDQFEPDVHSQAWQRHVREGGPVPCRAAGCPFVRGRRQANACQDACLPVATAGFDGFGWRRFGSLRGFELSQW